nr:hypothetical protein [Tanacetum cinerariifolium]
ANPTKVKVREQERAKEETRLLDSAVGRVVPLLPISPARANSELEASVERLFDESGNADQGDSAAGGGQDAGTGLVTGVKIVVAEDVTAEKPKFPRKKRQAVTDASGSSHPPKKLKGDYKTSGGVATSGKSPSILKELLARNMLNVEAGVAAVATLPMVTSSVFVTPKHESGAPADSIPGLNLRTIGASETFVISLDSSHHSDANASRVEDDYIIKSDVIPPVMTEAAVTSHATTALSALKTGTKVTSPVHASIFHDSDSTETVKADVTGPSYSTRQDLWIIKKRTKSEQNRTKSRANGKRGNVQTQAWQSQSPVKVKKASNVLLVLIKFLPFKKKPLQPRWENDLGKLFTAPDLLREGCNVLSEKLLDLHPHLHDNPLSGSTIYFSNPLLEEFADELPPEYNDNLQFDIESDLKEIEFPLYQDKDSSLKDSIDQKNRANLADIFVDSIPEMFTDEHTLDYSSPPIFDVYDDDFLEVESDAENVYDDPFDSKGEKIKKSKLLIDELDLPCDFHPPFEYDSFISQDFSKVDALPSTNNEDKIFNPVPAFSKSPRLSMPCEALSKEISSSILHLYALTFKPTVYVSHIRQFWSTARIETTEKETNILATVDGILRTVTGSSLRRNLKLQDEEGINEPASPLRDVSEGEACPTDSGFGADQDRANIAKTSTLPHDSTPRVTSPAADEGIKMLKDREGVAVDRFGNDAPIKGRNLDKGEAAAERVSDDTEEMATVLTSMETATVLASGAAEVPTGSGSIPTAGSPAAEVPTGSDVVPTANSKTPKKKKVQEQIDAQVARELEEQMAREDQRMSEQVARDAEVARIHAKEELQMMFNILDISNETTQQRKPWSKKQKRDYYMAVIKSNLGWKVKDFRGITFEQTKAKFTAVWKQIKDFVPMGSKEEAERFKRKGIRFEQESAKKLKTSEELPEEAKIPDEVLEEKVKEMMHLVPIEEVYVEALQVKHPIIDWKVHTKGQRNYWKIIRLGDSSASYQFFVDLLKHLDREDLNQLWALVKESLNNRPTLNEKEMELWVDLKRLYEPDDEDQLWTHTQNLMHAPVEWKLYDICGVHQVTSKDKEIFMLVEKDYPLRKGLAIVMICYKLQVENYSQMANDLILKIYKIANCPTEASSLGRIVGNKMHEAFPLPVIEFPLPEEVLNVSEESSHCQKKREATAVKDCTAIKDKKKLKRIRLKRDKSEQNRIKTGQKREVWQSREKSRAVSNVLNDSLLDDYDVSREFVDHLAPPAFFFQIREMDYHHLFTEFNVKTARQACLNVEVRMRTVLDLELKDLNVVVSSLRSYKDGLVDQVHAPETTCSGLHDQEYLSALGAAISLAIEKGMHDGFSASIDHGKAGRSLADVVAYNSVAEANYNSALQRLREAGRSLANVVAYNSVAEADYNSALQRLREPNVDQLMLLVHRYEDQVILGETSLSFSLSVTHSRVWRIREMLQQSATIATTTALSTTFAFASSVPSITIEDYGIAGTKGLKDAQGNVDSFPTIEFEKLIPKASLFCTISASAVLSVGMPISAGMTTFVPHVSKKGVSPFLDLIIVRCSQRTWEVSSIQLLLLASSLALIPSLKLWVIHVFPSSSTAANTSNSFIDFSFSSSTNTCLLRCAKLVDAILLSASDFLFLLMGTCLIENVLNSLRFFTPISSAILNPAIKASYSASLTKLISSDLIYPLTYQLLRNSSGDSGSDLSFDKSASPERFFGLARASLVAVSKLYFSFGCSRGDYTSSCPSSLVSAKIAYDMVWRHPDTAIDDLRPAAGSFNMADVRFMGIHDFLCLPEWTDDLAADTPSSKILAKARASQNQKAYTFGAALSHVAKHTKSALAQSFDSTTRPSLFAVIPSSGNQSGSSVAPTAEGSNTRDYRGNGIMADDVVAPSYFFPFLVGPYYATYPEDGVVGNYEFAREEWDALYRPTFRVLTKEGLSDDQLTAKMSVLHYMMMSHGGELLARYCGLNQSYHEYVLSTDSRLKGYEEKVTGLTGLELQVSTLKKQVFGLNDKLATSNASFSKSKAKGKKRKKKIKSLSKSLDNFHSEVACLSVALNQAIVLEAKRDEEILRLKATPPEFYSFFQGQFQGLLKLPLYAQIDYAFLNKISEYTAEPLSVILWLEPKKLVHPDNFPILRDTRVSPSIAKESTVTPVSQSLELSANFVPASSVVALEQNEEQVSDVVDGSDLEMTDGAVHSNSGGVFVQGTSRSLDDVAEVTVVGSERVSSGLIDVVVALSAREKGDGSAPSSTVKEVVVPSFGV